MTLLALLAGLHGCASPPDTDTLADTGDTGLADARALYWSERVESFWGDAPEEEERLRVFDHLWESLAEDYASFDSYDVDWEASREHYRPLVAEDQGYGSFYGHLRQMVDQLHDPHAPLLSQTVCTTRVRERPPAWRNIDAIPAVGGCVTLDDQGELLVYQVASGDSNPLDLEPGDVIVGFDGQPWEEALAEVESWGLPECDEDFAMAPVSRARRRAATVAANSHLFSTIEVRRYASGAVESHDTGPVIDKSTEITVCADQIPTPGLSQPVLSWAELDLGRCSNCLSWGVVPGTNIGFISAYAWYGDALDDLDEAVEALYETDALVVDQRFNLGGVVQVTDHGFPVLFDQDVDPVVEYHRRVPGGDYTELERRYDSSITADPETSYEGPIAVLTGPKSGSAGDLVPYALALHPRSRSFGRATVGAFGELAPVWYPDDPFLGDLSLKLTVGQMVAADGTHLGAWEQRPDEEVWITAADAAAGVDPVLEAALQWIESELD